MEIFFWISALEVDKLSGFCRVCLVCLLSYIRRALGSRSGSAV